MQLKFQSQVEVSNFIYINYYVESNLLICLFNLLHKI